MADRRGVMRLLEIMIEDYGQPTQMIAAREVPATLFSLAAAGDVRFLHRHPASVRYSYRTRFERRGAGFVFIEFFEISGKSYMRSISFALAADRPDARHLVAATAKRMFEAVKQP